MNKIAMLSMMLVAVLLCAGLASAAITVTDVTFGGPSQKRGENVTATVTVNNTETDPVTITGFASNTVAGKYNFQVDSTTIAASSVGTVTLRATVPLDHDAVDAGLVAKALEIGTFSLTNGTINSNTAKANMQAENRLDIRKVRVDVSGVTPQSESLDDGDDLEDLKPGDKISMQVEVKNTFSKSADVDFDDVTVELDFDEGDDFDLDDDNDDASIDASDEETFDFTIDIEDDADDGTTPLIINVEARDSNGAKHGETFRVDLRIERDVHDIVFRSVDLQPARLACTATGRTVEVTTNVRNLGRVDEDDVIVEARIDALSAVQRSTPTDLDEDDDQRNTFRFDVPKSAKPGVYDVAVYSYYDVTKKSNAATATFVVEDCTEPAETEEQETPTTVPPVTVPPVTVPPVTQPVQQPAQPVSTSTTTSGLALTESDLYLVGLTAGIAVIAVVIMLLLVRLFRRD